MVNLSVMRLSFDMKVSLSFIVIFVRLAFSRAFVQKHVDRSFIWSFRVFPDSVYDINYFIVKRPTAVKCSIRSMEFLVNSIFAINGSNDKAW